ncbi:MAG: M14 family zinc carboxypeptidase [Candidatus Marinimicrobia bacterium]|nr:M14 family zinc carboxypeptidase [Candidatus Neomarinimicrobiota bacterium]
MLNKLYHILFKRRCVESRHFSVLQAPDLKHSSGYGENFKCRKTGKCEKYTPHSELNMVLLKPLLIIFIMVGVGFAQESYDQVRIWSENTAEIIPELLSMGIDPEGLDVRRDVYVDVVVNQTEKDQVFGSGLMVEDLIIDLSAYYESQLTQDMAREFGYGSMGGYYTFDEIVENMDSLHAQYPEIVSAKDSIGSSYEGRTIWAFKISDNPTVDEAEPEVFYNSLIHAREPAAMMVVLYFAWELAENYTVDPLLSYLVNERELWFVPVINPDGYVYNELTNPNGGGMHRKNRKPGCLSSPGVDLNRNWGFQWGYNDVGSSPDNCAATYRGAAAFSEPETQAIRDFVLAHEFQTVLNYHTYGNLLIRPFGYDASVELPVPDGDIYQQLGQDLVADNHYLFGTGDETVGYSVNGDAVDYMYGDLGIINFTPEVGTWSEGGFWPPTDMIYELAEENLSMNIHLAGVAGSWVRLESFELLQEGPLTDGAVVPCQLVIKNKGLGLEDNTATLHLVSPDSSMIPNFANIDLSDLVPQADVDLGLNDLNFTIQAESGTLAQIILSIDIDGQYAISDTFFWSVGAPDTLFVDDLETGFDAWLSESWGTTSEAYSGALAMTDSPYGNYPELSTMEVMLNDPIDLRGYNSPVLSFAATWDIEFDYDFCQVLASNDGGNTWSPLSGEYTVSGNGATVQPLGEPGYHGSQDWVSETLSLDEFVGSSSVLLSFKLMSDTYYEGDGFIVDDLMVLAWGVGFHVGDITRDGLIDINDAVLLLEWIIQSEIPEDEALELSDLNHDSAVDILDMVLLIEVILAR